MKFDKDLVLKHRFWVIVGLSLPFAAVAILLLTSSVGADIEKKRSTLKDLLKKAQSQKSIKTPEEIEVKKAEANLLIGHKDKAWKMAFDEQEPLYRWPRPLEARFEFANGLFAKEVNLLKLPAEVKEWPEDKKGELLHGTLQFADNEKFTLLGRDGKTTYTFHITPELLKLGLLDQQKDRARLDVKDLGGQSKDVLLAVGYQQARYFNDPLTTEEQLAFANSYLTQIPPILSQVDPLRFEEDENGKKQLVGVVQLRASNGWLFDPNALVERDGAIEAKARDKVIPPEDSKFLRFVPKWDTRSDISAEAWIAEEDLWVQSEVYRLIRVANDSLAAFTEVSKDPKNRTATYRNPYFQMTLTLKDTKQLEVQVANLLNRRQKIEAMKVRIRFTDNPKTPPEILTLVTESKYADPLEPRGDPNGKDKRTIPIRLEGNQPRKGIFGMEQVLTWETAAVKRLDQIAIGSVVPGDTSLSQKLMPVGVHPLKEEKKADDAPADPQGGKAPGMTTPAPGGNGAGVVNFGPGGFGPGGKFGGAAAVNALANGLSPDRYLEVTPQFRRIPIAVVLIVDQNQVDRVLTAFNNSRLRFLMTQVLLNHYPKSLKPELPAENGEEGAPGGSPPAGKLPPGVGPMPLGGFFPGGRVGPGPGGFRPPIGGPGMPFGNGGDMPAAAADDMETNMELVLYGIVTLYERFPPRPGQPAAVGTDAAKTTP